MATNKDNIKTTQAPAEEVSLKTIEAHLKSQDLHMRQFNYITVVAFGGSICLIGLTLLIGRRVLTSNLFLSDDIFLILLGLAVMIAAAIGFWLESRTGMISMAKARRCFSLSGYFLIVSAVSITVLLIILKFLPSLHIAAFFFVPLACLSAIFAAIFVIRGIWVRARG